MEKDYLNPNLDYEFEFHWTPYTLEWVRTAASGEYGNLAQELALSVLDRYEKWEKERGDEGFFCLLGE